MLPHHLQICRGALRVSFWICVYRFLTGASWNWGISTCKALSSMSCVCVCLLNCRPRHTKENILPWNLSKNIHTNLWWTRSPVVNISVEPYSHWTRFDSSPSFVIHQNVALALWHMVIHCTHIYIYSFAPSLPTNQPWRLDHTQIATCQLSGHRLSLVLH